MAVAAQELASFYGDVVPEPPEPPAPRAPSGDALSACAPDHWYGRPDAFGLLKDAAGNVTGRSSPNGETVFPGAGPRSAGSGLTVRVLCDGGAPSVEWGGFAVAFSEAGTVLYNSYTGGAYGRLGGPPYAAGAYTTYVLSAAGSSVYVGSSLWAFTPLVAYAPGQGAAGLPGRVLACENCTLVDLQVYNRVVTPALVAAGNCYADDPTSLATNDCRIVPSLGVRICNGGLVA